MLPRFTLDYLVGVLLVLLKKTTYENHYFECFMVWKPEDLIILDVFEFGFLHLISFNSAAFMFEIF